MCPKFDFVKTQTVWAIHEKNLPARFVVTLLQQLLFELAEGSYLVLVSKYLHKDLFQFSLFSQKGPFTLSLCWAVSTSHVRLLLQLPHSLTTMLYCQVNCQRVYCEISASPESVFREIYFFQSLFGVFLIFFWLITLFDSGLVHDDVWFRTKLDIEPLQCIVLRGF